jgi:hypothetical protein
MPGETPPDLLPVRDAARLVDRSLSTVRAWIRSRQLRSWRGEGTHPDNAPALVSRAELVALVVGATGEPKAAHPGRPPAPAPPPAEAVTALRVELAAVRAELDGARALLGAHGETTAALREALAEARGRAADLVAALEAERARAVAAEAERDALRERDGLPWWRRLLGAPARLPGPGGAGEG